MLESRLKKTNQRELVLRRERIKAQRKVAVTVPKRKRNLAKGQSPNQKMCHLPLSQVRKAVGNGRVCGGLDPLSFVTDRSPSHRETALAIKMKRESFLFIQRRDCSVRCHYQKLISSQQWIHGQSLERRAAITCHRVLVPVQRVLMPCSVGDQPPNSSLIPLQIL